MKVSVFGDLNKYYVQTLCMVFFPGVKFSDEDDDDGLEISVKIKEDEEGAEAEAVLRHFDQITMATRGESFKPDFTRERTLKIAVGAAVIAAAGDLVGYRPSWGMLTGVRPSKVATEMLRKGYSKTRVKKLLASEYFVIPKKASLATEVALNEAAIIGEPDPLGCSLYVSIPFCPTRCAYCSFVSYTSQRLLSLIPEYIERVCTDVRETLKTINELGLHLKTVYIGGGTPTILDPDQLRKLLSTICEGTDVSLLEEFTLESGRPDTITAEKFAVAKEYSVDRVCVNPQSLCDEVLANIGREHTSGEFFRAYDIARGSGIKYINTDLIVGLPGDNFRTFSATYDKILQLRPDNITVHTFCVKKSSDILRRGSEVYSLRGGDAGKCVDYSQIKSVQAGYKPYYMYRQKNTVGNFENVGFALEGAEGRYNIYMMEEIHSIFAVGAGAVSKMVKYPSAAGEKPVIRRLFNQKYPYEYLREDRSASLCDSYREFYREYYNK